MGRQHEHQRERHVDFNLQSFSDKNTVLSAELVFKLWPSGKIVGCVRGRRKSRHVATVSTSGT